MKGNLSRLLRSGVAMLLVVCMVVGLVPATAFANAVEDDSVIHYVSLGASNTNGYGIDGYLPADVYEDPLAASKAELNVYGYNRAPEAAYPAQVAAELKAETGKEVKLHQLAISSMRVEEVRYLLDDTMEPDDYMNWRFTGGEKWFEIAEPGGVPALRKAYRESLAAADYVTVDLGWNNFGVFAFNQIKTIMADGSLWKDIEMSDYMNPEDEPTYQLIKSKAMEMLTADMTGADEGLKTKLSLMADVLAAATMGACYNYDIVLEKIYELNPDAKVVVINIQNLADDLVIDFEGLSLPLGDLYGELIDFVNLYRASESPYADECIFADVGDVTTFLDELVAWNGDPATLSGDTLDCFDMYDDSLYVRSIVEYMMAGQALSGLFKGFRDMAAGYGLEVFKDDSQYTYAFALSRSVSELLSLDLAKLDFNNPGGADMDVEVYGAAVAKHLKNLRAGKMDAYDYVFTDLSNGIQQQIAGLDKNELQNNKAQLEAAIQQLEAMNAPEDQISGYRAQLEAVNNGLLAFEAVETIIPAAKAEFHSKYEGVYNTYHNTLNYAYDLVATIFQEAAKINNLEINADSMNGFNNVSDTLMNAIAGSFIGGAQNKFYYELQKNGVQDTGVTEDPGLMVEDVLALLENDAAVRAIAVLAVRYELGNSFFAHPNPAGHDEITSAVMSALENGSDAGDFTDGKLSLYKLFLQERYPNLYSMIMGAQNIGQMDDLDIIINMLKVSGSPALAGVDLDALEDGIRSAYQDYAQSKTPEQMERAEEVAFDLLQRLFDLVAVIDGSNYKVTEDSYYVSLGDSTISGYGLTGYIDNMQNGANQVVTNSAHVLLAQEIYGEEWKNHFANFCQGSLRADDLLLFLGGEVKLDDYYYADIEPNLMEGTLEATQAKFIENVEKADLISVAIGGGNFLTFAGKYVDRVLGNTAGAPYKLDWERIGVGSADESMAELQEVLDLLVPIIDELGLLDQYLPEGVEIENPAKLARALAEGLIYGYASYNYYYTKVLERIKEINPDAQLLVLGMFNPVDDWTMTVTVNGEKQMVNIGGAVSNLMGSANLQSLAFALQNSNTAYIDVSEAETILEAENPGVELGFDDYYNSSFQSNGKAVHASVDGHKYIADQMATALSLKRRVQIVLKELFDLLETYDPETAEQALKQWEEHRDVDVVNDFKYIAIGDGSAETESYVESLTAALNAEAAKNGVDEIEVVNYARAGNTVAQERAALSDVTGADLITVGFSNVEFLAEAVDTAFHGGKFDWAAVVGAENVQYVDQVLAKVAATIAEAGVTGDIADMANDAIEAYAYSVVQYAVELPELVNEIHAANEDALIILIGMYNPLNGVTIDLGGSVTLKMDEYMDYLVMGAGIYGAAYSLLSGNSIYVDASEVQTENTKTVYGIRDLMELVTSNYAALYPSAAGDAYIASKIIEALDITYLSNHFIDVFPEEWYFDAVLWAAKNDITNGYGQSNTFCPNQDCTRAEIVTFLWRANGCPAPSSTVNPFVDIEEGSWYYDAVLWACEQGITEGYGDNEHFAPSVTCDRAQVATFLHRAKGEPAVNNAANPFIDIEEGTWYTEAVLWAAENEITVGYGEANTFRPELTCTRAQIVTFLYRAYK